MRDATSHSPFRHIAPALLAAELALAAPAWSPSSVAAAQEAPAAEAEDAATPPPAASQPATAPAADAGAGDGEQGERLRVVVQEVNGLVHVRQTPEEAWRRPEVGMELGEGAEFRTGPRSSVVCTIPPDQTIVLDRLGIVTVAEAVRRGGTTRTDLMMKYGRTEYEIEAAGARHDATIRSPSSTLAVRGTRVNLYDQPPFTPEARSYTGRAIYQYAKRQTALGGPGRGARVRGDQGSAAETALDETVVDPAFPTARTSAERALVASEVSRGGLVQFDPQSGINIVTNSPPLGDEELVANLPGRLNFVLRWTGDTDVNLVVTNTVEVPVGGGAVDNVLQEFIYPGFGLQQSPAGGRTAFNHGGGPGGGQEIVFYPDTFVPGQYTAQALLASRQPTDFTLNAFLDGQPINFRRLQFDEQGNIVFDPITRLPVLIEEPVIAGRLSPEDRSTPLVFEALQQGVVDLRDPSAVTGPTEGEVRTASQANAGPAAVDTRPKVRDRGTRKLEKQRKLELKRQHTVERRQARQLMKAERRVARESAATAKRLARKAR